METLCRNKFFKRCRIGLLHCAKCGLERSRTHGKYLSKLASLSDAKLISMLLKIWSLEKTGTKQKPQENIVDRPIPSNLPLK